MSRWGWPLSCNTFRVEWKKDKSRPPATSTCGLHDDSPPPSIRFSFFLWLYYMYREKYQPSFYFLIKTHFFFSFVVAKTKGILWPILFDLAVIKQNNRKKDIFLVFCCVHLKNMVVSWESAVYRATSARNELQTQNSRERKDKKKNLKRNFFFFYYLFFLFFKKRK